jgi:hypothetical protein
VRLKRICHDDRSYRKRRTELKGQLKKRGYKPGFIERQLSRVDVLDRTELLNRTRTTTRNNDRVPLVMTYSGTLPNVHNIITKKHAGYISFGAYAESISETPNGCI